MKTRVRLLLFVVLCEAVIGGAMGQGSAASFGGGGGGFGGGGGGLGGMNTEENRRGQRLENTLGLPWDAAEAVLTPGDRVVYRQKLKKDEVLFASATSDAFDPALTIEGPEGKELAKNDDREEGDQSPLLLFTAPADGTYTLKVLSYRSAAGGKFTVRRTIGQTFPADLGRTEVARSTDGKAFLRIAAKKGDILDLRPFESLRPGIGSGSTYRTLVGPTGVGWRDIDRIGGRLNNLIRCLQDGDYLLGYYAWEPSVVDIRRVKSIGLKPGKSANLNLEPREAQVVRIPVSAGDRLWTEIRGPADGAPSLTADEGTRTGDENRLDEAFIVQPGIVSLLPNSDKPDTALRLFTEPGTFNLIVRARPNAKGQVEVQTRTEVENLDDAVASRGSLAIGGSRLYLLRSGKSELMRLEAKSATFRPRIDILRLSGEVANTLLATPGGSAADALYFPDEGTFLVRLCAFGHGGSGSFELTREVYKPTSGDLGKTERLTLNGTNFGLTAYNLEANKRFEVVLEGNARLDLLSDDGQLIPMQGIELGSVRMLYFSPQTPGRYRLWIRGAPGLVRFQLRPTTVPKLDG